MLTNEVGLFSTREATGTINFKNYKEKKKNMIKTLYMALSNLYFYHI